MIIPESGKPADLDKTKIKTVMDADRVILWLTDVIADMDRQLAEAVDPREDWLRKAKSARWWAMHIRHQVREIRENILPEASIRGAIFFALKEFLDEEDIDDLNDFIGERFPHLSGVDIRNVS